MSLSATEDVKQRFDLEYCTFSMYLFYRWTMLVYACSFYNLLIFNTSSR